MIEFKTERLLIRPFNETDGEDFYEYFSDEEVLKFEPYQPYSKEKALMEAKRRESDERFLAVCLADGKLIGNLYFSKGDFDTWELGYVFNKKYWGHGYASESAAGLLRFAFETLNARRIIAMCDPLNLPSWKLLEQIGMRREGTLLQNIWFFTDENGQPIWKDTYEYAILKSEYLG